MISVVAPDMLARVGTALSDQDSVVVDDEDSGTDQDGVKVAERRGQDADSAADQPVLREAAQEATHDSAK